MIPDSSSKNYIEENELQLDSSVASNEKIKHSGWISWMYKLDSFGIETRGIERVSPEERELLAQKKKHSKLRQFINVLGLWVAACGGLTSMSSFFLPTLLFNLNFRDSLVSGLVSMIIGCLVPAYCSTMGAKSGCRQMVTAKFLFGCWGVRIVAIIVIISSLGWSVVNCVLGGQVLGALSGVPLSVGVVIISIVSLVVAVFGIKIVLKFQNIIAIPMIVASILFYVVVCKKYDYIKLTNELLAQEKFSGETIRGNWLSFFTIGYSVTATWGAGASDYYILFPENTPSWQVFSITFIGISVPTTFVALISIICGTIAYSYKPWNDAYLEYGVGGLINESCKPWGNFGKLIVVLLYISLVCNNIMNTYSSAFEFQLIDPKLALIPRWCWAILCTIIYLVVSLVGREHLSTILGNFLPMLAYWISMYITILLQENFIFRRTESTRRLHYREFENKNSEEAEQTNKKHYLYNWNCWNQPHLITFGIAALISFAIGIIGAAIGMNQVYWQGWVARKIGDYGGDIGFWICMGFTGITYPFLRYAELKYYGK
ncbi:uncharacterized protein AC631_05843 [Debaryomyces fabryi]|uniref:Vitamin B6 transporter TPN1 n=1 Tax=Debaryomyces fabryi TaxID=58627 RepID=A0A0V1PQV6_9ASCO|nr:uncharacterized protein AC631_05843 [Debaryomyces fabryi]KRZ98398.1 hypothetical protein AC631_05843 [Debaryomyces fabryi]CUM53149.1 unnamed protein product [Debaryomyces fabryi]